MIDCSTNVRLNIGGQDARYANLVLGTMTSFASAQYIDALITPPPFSDETCKRGCYYGYNRGQRARYERNVNSITPGAARNYLSPRRAPYEACGAFDDFEDESKYLNCTNVLFSGFYDNSSIALAGTRDTYTAPKNVFLTSRNMTLLKYYGAIACNATEGAGSYGYANFTNNLSRPRSVRCAEYRTGLLRYIKILTSASGIYSALG